MVTMRPSSTVTEIWRLNYWTHGPRHRKKNGRMERKSRKGRGREGKGKGKWKRKRKGKGEEKKE